MSEFAWGFLWGAIFGLVSSMTGITVALWLDDSERREAARRAKLGRKR